MKKFVGYARSTDVEEVDKQLERLLNYPCAKPYLFIDRHEAQDEPGPELKLLMSRIEPSDTIVVDKLSTFGLDEKYLNRLLDNLRNNNIDVIVLDSMS